MTFKPVFLHKQMVPLFSRYAVFHDESNRRQRGVTPVAVLLALSVPAVWFGGLIYDVPAYQQCTQRAARERNVWFTSCYARCMPDEVQFQLSQASLNLHSQDLAVRSAKAHCYATSCNEGMRNSRSRELNFCQHEPERCSASMVQPRPDDIGLPIKPCPGLRAGGTIAMIYTVVLLTLAWMKHVGNRPPRPMWDPNEQKYV